MKLPLRTTSVCLLLLSSPAHSQDIYGGISTSGIYTESASLLEDEDLQGSAIVGRGHVGAVWEGKKSETRVEASTAYFGYLKNRPDRWSNEIEAAHSRELNDKVAVDFLASAATNVATLESRSADQILGRGRLTFSPAEADRFRVAAAYRHRKYDDGFSTKGSAPYIEADYRRRLGRYNYLDASIRQEWTNSDDDFYDYKRLSVGGFYTHPLGRNTRARVGLEARRWKFEDRLALGLTEGRRVNLLLPQARLVHQISDALELEADYRRYIRESNDPRFERDGDRLAATIRLSF